MATNTLQRTKLSIIVGGISIIIVLALYLLRENMPNRLEIYLSILFALGCGGLSAALIGFITLKLNTGPLISSSGGFAIFMLIFFFRPVGFGDDSFTTIVLKNLSTDKSVASQDISLQIRRINGELRDGIYIPKSEAYQFTGMANDNHELEVIMKNNPGWVFNDNNKTILSTKIVSGKMELFLTRDTTFLNFQGRITDRLLKPIPDAHIVVVEMPNISAITNQDGYFHFDLPNNYPENSIKLSIQANGYTSNEDTYKLGHFLPLSLFKN